MQGVNNQNRWVDGVASVHPIVAGGDPEGAANDVHKAVLVLVPVVGPGVSPSDSLENLSQVHIHVSELSWENVKSDEIVVVLLISAKVVSDNAHKMMDKVACV